MKNLDLKAIFYIGGGGGGTEDLAFVWHHQRQILILLRIGSNRSILPIVSSNLNLFLISVIDY